MRKTLLLVFIHGFKGSDHTFHEFPQDVRALLSHALPKINIVSVQYPQFETRGDLKACVANFKEWLQDKVIDLEVENRTPSPTVDPSVHVVLCGHSMGGIVAAETLLSIARDDPVLPKGYANDTTNSTAANETDKAQKEKKSRANLAEPDGDARASSAPPPQLEPTRLFFPYIQAILAFDTPYLGISPGVLAHGAEEHIQQASAAYKAFDGASRFFGWSQPGNSTPQPIANASSRGLPAPDPSGWNRYGKYAMYGGAAAAIAGVAGAAYLSRNQIAEGLTWASSHLEFVGCLGRGAELQQRVEGVVELTRTHSVGFANFYTCLADKVSSKTQYAGAVLGQDRTFCVVPKSASSGSPTGTKRNAPSAEHPMSKKRRTKEEAELAQEMEDGEKVHQYVQDTSKGKGDWVKCVNSMAADELRAHTSMFERKRNPDYHASVDRARDKIVGWVDQTWYESSTGSVEAAIPLDDEVGGAENGVS